METGFPIVGFAKKSKMYESERISKGVGFSGLRTILSHELAMNRPPALEVWCSLLALFVVRKSYCTSLWWVPMHYAEKAGHVE